MRTVDDAKKFEDWVVHLPKALWELGSNNLSTTEIILRFLLRLFQRKSCLVHREVRQSYTFSPRFNWYFIYNPDLNIDTVTLSSVFRRKSSIPRTNLWSIYQVACLFASTKTCSGPRCYRFEGLKDRKAGRRAETGCGHSYDGYRGSRLLDTPKFSLKLRTWAGYFTVSKGCDFATSTHVSSIHIVTDIFPVHIT